MTDAHPVRLTQSGTPLVGDEPWPKEVVELAFEVWALHEQRNVRSTVDFLNALPAEYEYYQESDRAFRALAERTMPYKTVYNWVIVRKWEKRRGEMMKQMAPAMHRIVEDELRILTIDALRVQKELLLDAKTPAVVRAKIIDSILDRTGHQPFVRPADDSKPRGPQVEYTNTAAGMSIEQLREMLFGQATGNTDDSLKDEAGADQEENEE